MDLVEAVYFRYSALYIEVCETPDEAVAYLDSGEDWGSLSSVGVFVNGEPLWEGSAKDAPSQSEAEQMRKLYAEAARGDSQSGVKRGVELPAEASS